MHESNGMRFIGVDLAWQTDKNHSGIAVARDSGNGVILESVSSGIASVEAAVAFVVEHSRGGAVVAVDAPLIVTNQRGQRPCETDIGRRFGRYEASAHTTNLSLYPDPGGVRFRRGLEAAGFEQCADPAGIRGRKGLCLFEVYTHPAQVVLFDLDKTLKYKKGRLAQKRAALGDYRGHLRRLCKTFDVRLSTQLSWLFSLSLDSMAGRALKWHEDTFDAVFCALLACHAWRTGAEGNECFGDRSTGCIVNPKRREARPSQKQSAGRQVPDDTRFREP